MNATLRALALAVLLTVPAAARATPIRNSGRLNGTLTSLHVFIPPDIWENPYHLEVGMPVSGTWFYDFSTPGDPQWQMTFHMGGLAFGGVESSTSYFFCRCEWSAPRGLGVGGQRDRMGSL